MSGSKNILHNIIFVRFNPHCSKLLVLSLNTVPTKKKVSIIIKIHREQGRHKSITRALNKYRSQNRQNIQTNKIIDAQSSIYISMPNAKIII